MNILYIEEKYDFVVKNKISLDSALEYPNKIDRNMQSHRYAKSEINRHFANVLTTTRLYVDQGVRYGKKLDRLFGEPLVSFEQWFAQEYDARLGYRVMEALRNFVQHRGDAIHHASFGTYKEYIEDRMVIVRRIDTYLDPLELRKEKKFKASVLDELETQEIRITAQSFLGDYLEGLQVVHEKFRAATKAKYIEATDCISNAFVRYSGSAEDVIGLQAVEEYGPGQVKRSFSVLRDPIYMRDFYESKNPTRMTIG
ncbi:hypothetical protein OX462_14065 [Janthinobacterium sp. SUN098]|uniref:hypothetical protein n=1 Tax=Janthinobacterium sp. SUN098 TaxID=3002437 RepID=UPI0038D3F99D